MGWLPPGCVGLPFPRRHACRTQPTARFWVLGFGFWVLGSGFWVLGFGFWALGLGF
jgi:hypothetical protein